MGNVKTHLCCQTQDKNKLQKKLPILCNSWCFKLISRLLFVNKIFRQTRWLSKLWQFMLPSNAVISLFVFISFTQASSSSVNSFAFMFWTCCRPTKSGPHSKGSLLLVKQIILRDLYWITKSRPVYKIQVQCDVHSVTVNHTWVLQPLSLSGISPTQYWGQIILDPPTFTIIAGVFLEKFSA